ncbi:Probable sugar-transport integral membrane protein [Mycobacteroides abscessus]|nr:Probable sugar-transport integral membrane protein [Mycobacteroides abscessus]
MSLITDLRSTSRLGVMVAVTAAAVGVIYGYDSSNIAGALLFLTEDLTFPPTISRWPPPRW